MKVIAFYLPQFHDIPENDKWWGKGFTEWTNVKKAKSLYSNHIQPRIPLNNNYYNLLDNDVKRWQAKIAKDNGIYGFCYYHYWFSGKKLLQKPMEQMLADSSIDIPFCICWANDSWTKAWVGEKETLIEQKYGDKEEWEAHFNYFLQFFKDSRYIKDNNCPLLVIYKPENIECLEEMIACWKEMSIKNGFDGIDFAYQTNGYNKIPEESRNENLFKYDIEFEPGLSREMNLSQMRQVLKKGKEVLTGFTQKYFGSNFLKYVGSGIKGGNGILSYDELWTSIISRKPRSEKTVAGAFVDWDNTPRLGRNGTVVQGACPDKFKYYFSEQVKRIQNHVYKNDYLFIFAWNEWAESGYLEPDEKNGYGYLNAIREILDEYGEKE